MIVKIVLFLTILISSLYSEPYEMGTGYQLGNTPLHLGGYLSSEYDTHRTKRAFDLDEVAVMLYGSFESFDFLSELESSNLKLTEKSRKDFEDKEKSLRVERLYFNFPILDETSVIVGKFNADMGFWNQTPINVLRDTTTHPHIMENLFPKLLTGLGVTHALSETGALSCGVQNSEDLDENYNNLSVKKHYYLSLKNRHESYTWGVGGGYFEEHDDRHSNYATLGLEKTFSSWTLMSEFYTRDTHEAPGIPYDLYLQSTWHIRPKHDLILRAETYKDEVADLKENVGLIGYTYRPYPFMALKGEYAAHTKSELNHAIFSFSVIF